MIGHDRSLAGGLVNDTMTTRKKGTPLTQGRRNGGIAASWAPWIIAMLALGSTMFSLAKDTPTRSEMERKMYEQDQRWTQRYELLISHLQGMEARIDKRFDELERRRAGK